MIPIPKRKDAEAPDPTEEQLAIIDFIRSSDSNLMVNALAGTGKTTTLEMIQAASKRQPVLCLAFNRRIADEMERRFPSTTVVRTFNGMGHRVWASVIGRNAIKLDDKGVKMSNILKEETADLKGEDRATIRESFGEILKAVSLAKALGYVPEGKFPTAKRLITKENLHAALEERPGPLEAELIDTLLFRSIKASYEGWIDYNDQVYMPALFGGTFPRFPLVLIDEYQDLNPTNHEMCRRLITGRMCAVGDPWQSIYAFRGAVQGGMQEGAERFKCEVKDLSISFRCPRAIVEAAHWRVPHLKWVKEGGLAAQLTRMSLLSIPEGAAVLCRNNAPLFRLALALLQHKRGVTIAGSEVGPRLVRLLQRIGTEGDDSDALCAKIDAWLNEKLEKSNAPASLRDTAECLKVFANFGKTFAQAIAYTEHLFKQQGSVKLSTGHKAKGLEWDCVYFLDPWLCSETEQDKNLRYVIQTRSKQLLFEVDTREIRW